MRQRKSFERLEGVRPARLIVIAAEGRYTENIYFEAMKTAMCASDVHVEVLRRDTNESNPDNVLRQILNFQNVYEDRKSTRLNSSHANISYAVFCLKKKYITNNI